MAEVTIKKKVLFYIISIVLFIIVLELFSFFLYFIITGKLFSYSGTTSDKISLLNEDDVSSFIQRSKGKEIIHPYFGYVYNPEQFPSIISDFGFMDDKAPLMKRENNKTIIGVLGGSVAYYFTTKGDEAFINYLREDPYFADREIEIVRLALGGFKQPQQMLVLSYLLTIGAEFDIIINIDGFNEVALPPSSNLPKNVNPFFPRNWYYLTGDLLEPEISSIIEKLAKSRKKRKSIADLFCYFPLRYSISSGIIWNYLNRRLTQEIYSYELLLAEYTIYDEVFMVTGPAFSYSDERELFEKLTDIWYNGSMQMNNICRQNNIHYFHFLQPNQYTGLKELTETEKRIAYDEYQPYRYGVVKGYGLLRNKGMMLIENGVNYTDLAEIFIHIQDLIYIDTCCHFNKLGNNIIAERIASEIIRNIRAQ